MGERLLGDQYDSYEKKTQACERTICGHVDLSPRGMLPWLPPYGIGGAVINKVTDSTMAEHLTLAALAGHACGLHFKAAEHLKQHPEFNCKKKYLRDMNAHPWPPSTTGRCSSGEIGLISWACSVHPPTARG